MTGHLDRRSPSPLYYQFKQSLLERFENGEFPAGRPIPPEMDLMKQYGVSRATVRRAMQEMEHEGYIQRTPGRGTFVLRTRIRRGLTRMSSFTEDMQERGQTVTSQLLDFGLKVPPPHIAQQFGLGPEVTLLFIYRLRLADGSPVVINASYLQLPPQVSIAEQEVRAAGSLWGLLERKGLHLIEADRFIEAVLATEERANLLGVPVGTALLLVEGMAYTINHIPVEYSQVISSSERYKYSLHLER